MLMTHKLYFNFVCTRRNKT